MSIFPHLLGGTMATSQTCCHLPGEMLNSAAECADRARILTSRHYKTRGRSRVIKLPEGVCVLKKNHRVTRDGKVTLRDQYACIITIFASIVYFQNICNSPSIHGCSATLELVDLAAAVALIVPT
jgi:hypothetical protein